MNKKHPEIFGNLSKIELAAAFGNLRYDSLAEYINLLADDLYSQADLDFSRGRFQLCQSLWKNAEHAYLLAECLEEKTWKICEKYMDDL